MTTATYDIEIAETDFSATEMTFTAKTDKGKEFFDKTFGLGIISVTMPKSRGEAFLLYLKQHLLTVN